MPPARASFLRPRFLAARTTTLFSATLTPMRFHADLLGLPPDVAWVDVESPFDASQLRVTVAPLSTRFAHRPACRGQRVALPTAPAFAHKLHSLPPPSMKPKP